jgi:PAS domain S-box-containing protein
MIKPSVPERVRGVAIGATVLLAAAALVALAGEWAARSEIRTQTDGITRAIEVNALALRGTATHFSYLPYTAAQHPDVIAALVAPKDAAVLDRANRYLEDVNRRAGSVALYVMDVKGLTLMASNWNEPASATFVGHDYGNRPYFLDARDGRSGMFYGVGQTTRDPGLFISAPVRRGGVLLGVVAVKVSLHEIEAAWSNARDPVMLSDARGIFFLGSVPQWTYQSTRVLSQVDLERVSDDNQYGARRNFPLVAWSLERTPGQAAYRVSAVLDGRTRHFLARDEALPELGWSLSVMSDYAPVTEARVLTWTLGSLGAALLLLGGMYWRLRERSYAEQRDARGKLELQVRERTGELQEAHAFRKAMEDSLLVGMRARDLQGRIIYVNPALCEITGFAAAELVGRLPPYPYWHPDDMEKHWSDNDAAMSGRAALTGFESRILHKDGHEVHTMVYTAPLIDGTGQHSGWMSSVVDISEQKRADARQRLHERQLQHSSRLASLGEMASTLAHELNQPLMALSNFASAAQAFALQGNQPLLVSSLDQITAQAQRSADIVQRIRGFVRQRTQGVETCSIEGIVANVLALLQAEIRLHRAKVLTRTQAATPTVPGDRVLIEQVLLNLVLNSLQAMQDSPERERLVEVETTHADGWVCVRVMDRGAGVEPAATEQLFEPFFTTKPDGLGLGLNICRTIIESHGGHLTFENRADGGAIFSLQLPTVV